MISTILFFVFFAISLGFTLLIVYGLSDSMKVIIWKEMTTIFTFSALWTITLMLWIYKGAF